MEKTHLELYQWYTDLVSRGLLAFEQKAREVAERHGLPLNQLNNSLYYGQKIAYYRCLESIRNGRLVWIERARELAAKREFPLGDLEKAIEDGKKAKLALQH